MVYSKTDDNIEPIAKLEVLIQQLNAQEDVMDSYIKYMLEVRLNNIKLAMSVTPSSNKSLSIKKVLKEANNQFNK